MPKFWICAIVILIGLGLIAYGVYNLKVTRSVFESDNYRKSILIKGIANIIIGVLALIFPMAIGNTVWTVMVYILAFYLIVSAGLGFYSVTLLKNAEINRKQYVYENLTLLLIAIILFLISPNKLGLFIVRIIGIVVMVIGVILAIFRVKSAKDIIIIQTESDEENSDSANE